MILNISGIIEKVLQIESGTEFTQAKNVENYDKENYDIHFVKNKKHSNNCEICGNFNHMTQNCRLKNVRCFKCQKLGHYA